MHRISEKESGGPELRPAARDSFADSDGRGTHCTQAMPRRNASMFRGTNLALEPVNIS